MCLEGCGEFVHCGLRLIIYIQDMILLPFLQKDGKKGHQDRREQMENLSRWQLGRHPSQTHPVPPGRSSLEPCPLKGSGNGLRLDWIVPCI